MRLLEWFAFDEPPPATYIELDTDFNAAPPEMAMPLAELERIKQWHMRHQHDHPLEQGLWDAMLTLWVMGWVGWLPVYALQQLWAIPLCMLSIAAPGLYAAWRIKAHRARRLRCDWAR